MTNELHDNHSRYTLSGQAHACDDACVYEEIYRDRNTYMCVEYICVYKYILYTYIYIYIFNTHIYIFNTKESPWIYSRDQESPR